MQQPRTEADVEHTGGQQDTGNHYEPGTPEAGGPDRFGGTRAGAENVERVSPDKAESVETGTDVGRASDLGEANSSEKSLGNAGSIERA
jgi:hypothetical protein